MNSRASRNIGQTNLKIDDLGFGCAPVGNLYNTVDDHAAATVLTKAWDAGFRYFDTAPHYGQGLSERRVGDLLRPLRGKEYILSTKVGRVLRPSGYARERHGFLSPMPFDIEYDYSYDGVMRSFEDSLQRLGLDRIDIIYMHDIGKLTHDQEHEKHFKLAMDGGYRAMDSLRSEGSVKAIGLGVNEYQVCEAALEHGDWDCFMLAGRYTLLEQEALATFLPKCETRNCSIIIGGVYNSGILATGTQSKGVLHYDYEPAPAHIIDKVRKLEVICEKFKIPLAAAALQFPYFHPSVVSVVPGISNPKRIADTIKLRELPIPVEFWAQLRKEGLVAENTPLGNGV